MLSKKVTVAIITAALISTTGLASAKGFHGGKADFGNWKQHKEHMGEDFGKNCEPHGKMGEKAHNGAKYEFLQGLIKKMLDEFEAANLDTSKLKNYLEELKLKMDTAATTRSEAMAKLKEAHELKCDGDSEQFPEAMDEFRASMKVFWEQLKETHDYFRKTVHPEIKDLRDQLKGEEESDS